MGRLTIRPLVRRSHAYFTRIERAKRARPVRASARRRPPDGVPTPTSRRWSRARQRIKARSVSTRAVGRCTPRTAPTTARSPSASWSRAPRRTWSKPLRRPPLWRPAPVPRRRHQPRRPVLRRRGRPGLLQILHHVLRIDAGRKLARSSRVACSMTCGTRPRSRG